MAEAFDIDDRDTWDWVPESDLRESARGLDYRLDPRSPDRFLQRADGDRFVVQSCPAGMNFNPTLSAGPVCDHPWAFSEADVYAWAVAEGFVNDQR